MTSPKTTIAGILAIVGALVAAGSQWTTGGFGAINWTVLVTAIVTGVGLILAKDFNVTNSTTPGPSQKVGP